MIEMIVLGGSVKAIAGKAGSAGFVAFFSSIRLIIYPLVIKENFCFRAGD